MKLIMQSTLACHHFGPLRSKHFHQQLILTLLFKSRKWNPSNQPSKVSTKYRGCSTI